MQKRNSEILVGIFLIIALLSILFICLQTANVISIFRTDPTYRIYATFNNVNGLKIRAPVRIGGVVVGRVANISLDKTTYLPYVAIDIEKHYNHIPSTSSLSICTSGLLGEKYLALNIGFEDPELETSILGNGDTIQDTNSSLSLEDIIGQFFYNHNKQ